MVLFPGALPLGRPRAGELGDRRGEARAVTIFAYGKLTIDGVEQLCHVRDISSRGIRIETPDMPEPGTQVTIEMRGLAPCPAKVVWRDGDRGALEFAQPQTLGPIFQQRAGEMPRSPRSPRFLLSARVMLHCIDKNYDLEVVDISFGGLKLSRLPGLDVGRRGTIVFGASTEGYSGRICWKKGPFVGFRFDRAMHRHDLIALLAR